MEAELRKHYVIEGWRFCIRIANNKEAKAEGPGFELGAQERFSVPMRSNQCYSMT